MPRPAATLPGPASGHPLGVSRPHLPVVCEFLELWKSGFVTFTSVNRGSDDRNPQSFPDCEPCCLANYTIQFVTPQDPTQALGELAVFIRLWRKLEEHCGDGYSLLRTSRTSATLQF